MKISLAREEKYMKRFPEICSGPGLYVGRGKMGMKMNWKSKNMGQAWRARGMNKAIWSIVVMLMLADASHALAAKAKVVMVTVREVAEALAKQSGKTAGREFVETTSVQLARISVKCGAESLEVINKHGIKAFRVFLRAGDDAGPYLVQGVRLYGDDAIRIAQTSAGRSVLRGGNPSAIRSVARHGDAALPVLRQYGDSGARALEKLSPANGRRLIRLAEDNSIPAADLQKLMGPVQTHGDRAMDFIWRHRKLMAGTAVVGAFVANPEPFLDGLNKLAEQAAKPMGAIAMRIVDSIRWNLWIGLLAAVVGLKMVIKSMPVWKRAKVAKEIQ